MRSKLLSLVALVALTCSAGCAGLAPDHEARGSAAITWSITLNGRPATCTEAGAASVALRLHPRSGAEATATFPCTDTRGTLSPVPASAYEATLLLRATDGSTIATAATQTVRIGAGQAVELAAANFVAPARGMLVLSLAALTAPRNCQPRDQGGAGITAFLVSLEHAGDGCAPVTFTRSRGGIATGMYTVNCGSPAQMRCMERDEILAVDGLDAGAYAIHVEGDVGPSPCWDSRDALLMPGGQTLVKAIQLAPQSVIGC